MKRVNDIYEEASRLLKASQDKKIDRSESISLQIEKLKNISVDGLSDEVVKEIKNDIYVLENVSCK